MHKGKAYPGEHEPIIDQALFVAVQDSLVGRRVARLNWTRAAEPSLLGGRLFDAQGERMSPSHAVKNNKRYRYYTSQSLLHSCSRKAGQVTRVPAHDIEAVVIAEVRLLLQDPGALLDMLTGATPDLAEQQALLRAAAELAERWPGLTPAEIRALVRAVVGGVIMRKDRIDIELVPVRLRAILHAGPGTVPAEVADTTLIDAAADGTPVDLEFAYTLSAQAKLVLTAHEVYLPKPKLAVEGPGGVQASFDFRGAKNDAAGQMLTVTLTNDLDGTEYA